MKTKVFDDKKFGSYSVTELDCGLKIFIMEKKNYSSYHAVFGTKYGSIDTSIPLDDGGFKSVPEGIAHFLEHKLFESEDKDAFSRFSQTGAYANAYTTFDRTCYLFNCSDRFFDNLEILLDFVQSPFFTEESVKKEQGIIAQEIKMYEDSPNWRVLFNMLRQMFEVHPVKIDIAGTCESIKEINSKLLYDCYNAFYSPSNMCICIAGNVDAKKTVDFINQRIKSNERTFIKRNVTVDDGPVLTNYAEQYLSVANNLFCFGYKEKCGYDAITIKNKLVADIMLEILCGDCSALYRELIEKGLINDEFSSEYFYGPGYSVVFFDGESNNPKAVADSINNEILRMINDGIDDELFEAVKKSSWGDYVRRFESLDGVVSDMIEAAFNEEDLFETESALKEITKHDILKRLKGLKADRAVLSVIKRKD